MTDTTNLITIPHKTDVPAMFADNGKDIKSLITEIEKQARNTVFDVSTNKGRTAAKSLAAKISRSKTLIDEVGKEQNEERNRLNKEVNAVRNEAKERLDALRDEVKAPVLDWENKEAERVRLHEINMDAFSLDRVSGHSDSADIQGVIHAIEAINVTDGWEEYEGPARAAQAAALTKYQSDLAISKAREDQAAELEALRKEKEEREEADRIAANAAAEQKAEAELQAQAERLKQKALEDAREANAKEAEARRIEHEQELADAKAKAKQAEEDAARREKEAAQRERDRIASEEAEKLAAEEKRASDKKHRLKVRGEIVKALSDIKAANYEEMVDAMIWGKIPHVKVSM